MLADWCLNARGRSAEDVAEVGRMHGCVFLFVYSGAAFESKGPCQRGSRETGGENARSRWKAATKGP